MKTVFKKLLFLAALPIALVVVGYLILRGIGGCQPVVCDPVHRPDPGSTRPADNYPPPVCDPVHVPPPTAPAKE